MWLPLLIIPSYAHEVVFPYSVWISGYCLLSFNRIPLLITCRALPILVPNLRARTEHQTTVPFCRIHYLYSSNFTALCLDLQRKLCGRSSEAQQSESSAEHKSHHRTASGPSHCPAACSLVIAVPDTAGQFCRKNSGRIRNAIRAKDLWETRHHTGIQSKAMISLEIKRAASGYDFPIGTRV